MYEVSFRSDSFYEGDRQISVNLNPNQVINLYTWKPPIIWKGFVGSTKVTLIQIERSAFDLDAFDWTNFPIASIGLRREIVQAIDNAMRTMD